MRLLCLHTCASLGLLCRQASAPITVWVKRTDVTGARYAAVNGVDPQQTVDNFIARWAAEEELRVRPSLVTLRLVTCEARKPKPAEEQTADELEPFDTMATAGVVDGCKLLVVVAGACGAVRSALPPGGDVLTRRPRGSPGPEQDAKAAEAAVREVKAEVMELKAEMKQTKAEVKAEMKAEVKAEMEQTKVEMKAELQYAGQLPLSTRAMAEIYRDKLSALVLRLEKLPIWFAPDPTAPAWTPLPPNTSEAEVQKQFERAMRPLAAASRAPALVLVGRSTTPSIGTRKPDMVGYVAMAPAEPAGDMVAVSNTVTHIVCFGSLKPRRAADNDGKFTDEEKGGVLDFAVKLLENQQWRAEKGSLARVVAFLSDGAHIVFFECTFRVDVNGQALRVSLVEVRESASLPLAGEGGAYLAGLTRTPLDALGYELPQCEVAGAPVELRAYLGMGATSHGFAATWRGDDAVVLKRYHAATPPAVVLQEQAAHHAAAGVPGVCQLRGEAAGCLLLAPRGAVSYSLHARSRADAAAPAPAGLWSVAAPPAPPAVPASPVLPGAAEFCDLLDALAGLHAAGWVHRDPRPANFFRDAAGRFFLADLGSAARIGDAAAAAADTRPWAPQYGPLAALRATADGLPPPAPEATHDFEQVARLVYAAQARDADMLTMPADDAAKLAAWWAQRDARALLRALLPAAAAAAQGAAARRAFQDAIRRELS